MSREVGQGFGKAKAAAEPALPDGAASSPGATSERSLRAAMVWQSSGLPNTSHDPLPLPIADPAKAMTPGPEWTWKRLTQKRKWHRSVKVARMGGTQRGHREVLPCLGLPAGRPSPSVGFPGVPLPGSLHETKS